MLENRAVEAIKDSWRLASVDRREIVRTFYARLFEKAPEVRPLFPENMQEQRQKLLSTLETLVYGLTDLNTIMIELSALGSRHAEYGAEAEHYPLIAETLLEAFSERLGDAFTGEHERAWGEALDLVATIMLDAQRAVAVAATR